VPSIIGLSPLTVKKGHLLKGRYSARSEETDGDAGISTKAINRNVIACMVRVNLSKQRQDFRGKAFGIAT
jgi:hypothetical protein